MLLFSGEVEIKDKFYFKKNHYYVLVMDSNLKSSQYIIKMKFRAFLTGDLAGLYKSTYKKKNGENV